MQNSHFQIVLSKPSASAQEWRRALAAPSSELPPLSEEQKEVARKFNVTEEEYARNVLAGCYGQQSMRKRAQQLGEAVQSLLAELGGGRVIAVVRETDRPGWIVRIETRQRDVDVFVSRELADDLLDSGSGEERERLRARVASSLEEHDLTVSR